ncbi:endonuclease V [Eisenibacter elegans]|uniref:endonuclease V n=1 Tax=Eisenibacter elegans TaxID=997 RepID=UPI0003FD269E|nr:endonuclease V [Eisenibacter elegans]
MEHDLLALAQAQAQLQAQVHIPPAGQGFVPQIDSLLLTLDVQYKDDEAFVAGDFQYYDGQWLYTLVTQLTVGFPYVSGYFCFREGPVLQAFYDRVLQAGYLRPDILLVDGHGIAHPRGLGVASWLGIHTGQPCVGVAKRALLRYEGQLAEDMGSTLPLLDSEDGTTVGYVVRTQASVKPLFVSPGHLVSVDQSLDLLQHLQGSYRLPECIRRADQAARAFAVRREGDYDII